MSLKNIAGDTVPEFCYIWIPFIQELLHSSKNYDQSDNSRYGVDQSITELPCMQEKKTQGQNKPAKPDWRVVS